MNSHFLRSIKNASSLLLRTALGIVFLCVSAHANSIFHVTVSTASLIGSSSAPFSLDFQFNNGSLLGNNTGIVSNFTYAGGSPVGSATTFGGATGNIGSSVIFNNSAPFQELFQAFTPGTSLGFDVNLTTNLEAPTPDAFVFAILDKNLANIPTTGLGDSLLLVNVNSANPTKQTFTGTGAFANVTAVATPETGSYLLLLSGLPLIVIALRRTRRSS